MVLFRPEDLYSAGESASDFQKGLATDIANAVCGLYQNAPKGFVTGTPVDGAGAFLRGYWDSFCGRLPEPKLPSPPSVPFQGGQCACRAYNIAFSYVREVDGVVLRGTSQVIGPITGKFENKAAPPESGQTYINGVTASVCQNGQVVGSTDVSLVASADRFKLGSMTITPADGQPDTCGDLPADYPSGAIPPPTNPREYVHPSPGGGSPVRIPYSVDFDPTLVVPIVKVDLNGELEVPVTFDAGGIDIGLPDFNIGGGDSGGISPGDLEALLDAASKIPGIQENIQDLVNGGNQTSDNLGEKEGEQEGYVPNISGLVIQVTGIPSGAGRKFGKPEVFNFGRAHFKRGDFYSSEIPIATVQQWCSAPPDSDGYAIYLIPGVTANVTVVKQVKENGG